jgi:hypothetical protein
MAVSYSKELQVAVILEKSVVTEQSVLVVIGRTTTPQLFLK